MQSIERLGLWAALVAIAAFTAMNVSGLRQLRQAVEANTADLDQPAVEAGILPGIPADLRGAWRAAKNNAPDTALTDQLWLTVRLTNEGAGDAGEVIATLSFVNPIRDIFVHTPGGETFESEPYGRPSLAEGGRGERKAEVEFGALRPGQSHIIFVGLRPRSFGTPPYDQADYVRWSDEFARHWNTVRVSSAVHSGTTRRTTVVEYGLGSSGLPLTAADPVRGNGPG